MKFANRKKIIPFGDGLMFMFTGAAIFVTDVDVFGVQVLEENAVVAVIVVFDVAILVGTK